MTNLYWAAKTLIFQPRAGTPEDSRLIEIQL